MYSLEEFQSLHIFSPSYLDTPPPKRFIQFIPFISAALQYRIQALDQKHLNHQVVNHVFQQAKSLSKWAGSHIMFRSTILQGVCVCVFLSVCLCLSMFLFFSLSLPLSILSLHAHMHAYIHTHSLLLYHPLLFTHIHIRSQKKIQTE